MCTIVQLLKKKNHPCKLLMQLLKVIKFSADEFLVNK